MRGIGLRLGGLLWLAIMSGCAALPDVPVTDEPPARVAVYFGTDRDRAGEGADELFFGTQRGVPAYGIATGVVPPGQGASLVARVVNALETRLEDGEALVTVEDAHELERAAFWSRAGAALAAADEPAVLLYVHGYQKSFYEAMQTATLLAERLDYDGLSLAYSWPSRANPAAYVVDATNMRWAQPHLNAFIDAIDRELAPKRLIIVAHSMGSQGVTRYLVEAAREGRVPASLLEGHLVLVAPDIDQAIFKRDVAPVLREAGIRTTVYVSAGDQGMRASRTVHAYPRLGDADEGVEPVPGFDVIDVTAVNPAFLGHNYHEQSAAVLRDMRRLLDDVPVDRRDGLVPVDTAKGRYWELR